MQVVCKIAADRQTNSQKGHTDKEKQEEIIISEQVEAIIWLFKEQKDKLLGNVVQYPLECVSR